MSDTLLITLARSEDCLLRIWDTEAIAFHVGSGDTHLLGELATAVLLFLQSHGKCQVLTLCANLLSTWHVEDIDAFHEQTLEVIDDLRLKGLVEVIT